MSYSLTQYRVLVSEWQSFLHILSDHVTELPHVGDETRLVSPGIVSVGFPRMKYDRRDLPIARKERVKNGYIVSHSQTFWRESGYARLKNGNGYQVNALLSHKATAE